MPCVLIRADAAPNIGVGHVRRCLVLARALSLKGCTVRFASAGGSTALADLLQEFWDTAIVWPELLAEDDHDARAWDGNRQNSDLDAILAAAAGFCPQWVIVDHYNLSAHWHQKARRIWGCKIVAIDDLANRPLDADLIVDHNWHEDHRAKYAGYVPPKALMLGGPRFALIDPKFKAEPPLYDAAAVKSVGVFVGGTDPARLTLPVVTQVRAAGFAGQIEVVSTTLNPRLPELVARLQPEQSVSLSVDLPDLHNFFLRHDLFILSGGGTTWERMASGVPAVVVVAADNQRATANQLAAMGLQWTIDGSDVGSLAEVLPAALADANTRSAMARAGRALVDGAGGDRVALALLASSQSPVLVRRAKEDDAAMVYSWRNNPAIRAVSRNQAMLDWDAHQTWFAAAVTSGERLLLIGECAGRPIGMVRFDRLTQGSYEISIFVDPQLAGLRLGGALLEAAQLALLDAVGDAVSILAETRPDNQSSQRMFLRAGYVRQHNSFRLSLVPESHLPPA